MAMLLPHTQIDTPSKPEDQLSHFKNLYFALLEFEKVPSLASKCKKK